MMIPAQTGIHVIFSCGVSSYSDQAVIVSFTDFYRKLKKFYINLFENLFANLFLFENENRTRTKKNLIFANKNRTRTKNILNAANENRTRTKKISVFFHPCWGCLSWQKKFTRPSPFIYVHVYLFSQWKVEKRDIGPLVFKGSGSAWDFERKNSSWPATFETLERRFRGLKWACTDWLWQSSILMSHNLWVIRMNHQVAPEFELFSFCWDCLFTGLHNLQF